VPQSDEWHKNKRNSNINARNRCSTTGVDSALFGFEDECEDLVPARGGSSWGEPLAWDGDEQGKKMGGYRFGGIRVPNVDLGRLIYSLAPSLGESSSSASHKY
jgi:hypothetical protein